MRRGGWNTESPYSRTNADKTAEQHMWRHVLRVAILDASGLNHEYRLDVGKWLDSEDFYDVCEYAGCNPRPIHEQMKRILLAKWPVSWALGWELRKAILYDDDLPEE